MILYLNISSHARASMLEMRIIQKLILFCAKIQLLFRRMGVNDRTLNFLVIDASPKKVKFLGRGTWITLYLNTFLLEIKSKSFFL